MDLKLLADVLKKIFTNPVVIGTTIVVILYMNFCSFVANYKRKPPKPKKKKSSSQPVQAPVAEPSEGTEENAEEADSTLGGMSEE